MRTHTFVIMCALAAASALTFTAFIPSSASADVGDVSATSVQIQQLQAQGVKSIIVQYASPLSASAVSSLREDAGVVYTAPVVGAATTEVDRIQSGSLSTDIAALEASPGVIYAEPNAVVQSTASISPPNNPDWNEQWAFDNTGYYVNNTPGDDIGALSAWTESKGAGAVIAVVDTGIDYNAPSLNGQIDPGYDFINDDSTPQDENGHGTFVAGEIAAVQNNGVGTTGLAPAAKIMPLRVLDASGNGSYANVIAAFNYAGNAGIRVVNASLGGPSPSEAMTEAITSHPNTLYVVAAGNNASNNDATPFYPCNIAAANLLCVGASDGDNEPASFSDYGASSVNLFAPGVDIASTWLSDLTDPGCSLSAPCPETGFESGTSMATPLVAATAALMLGVNPNLTTAQLKAGILNTVTALPAFTSLASSGGILNTAAAVNSVDPAPAPVIALGSVPAASTTSTSASFSYTVSNPAYAISCTLDSNPFPCNISGAGATGLGAGNHVFVVTTTGPGGSSSQTVSWSVTSTPVTTPAPKAPATTTPTTPTAPLVGVSTPTLNWTGQHLSSAVISSCQTHRSHHCRAKTSVFSFAFNASASLHIVLARKVNHKLVPLATVTLNEGAGNSTYVLSARLAGGKSLAPGRYLLSAVGVSGSLRSTTYRTAVTVKN